MDVKKATLKQCAHLDPEVRDEVIEEAIRSSEEHIKKYGMRRMSLPFRL